MTTIDAVSTRPAPAQSATRAILPWVVGLVAVAVPTAWAFVASDEIGRWTILLGILASLPCAVLGCYLVLRKLSLLGDAISHAVLPGIAVGFLLSGSLIGPAIVLGAMAVGMLTALLTQLLSSLGRVPEDASMGVVFTSLFAVGVLIITNAARDVDLDPGCVLYGLIELAAIDSRPILGVEVPRSLGTLGLATALTVGFVALLWKELKLVSFDPALATAVGISATAVHYALMAMVAGVTVAAFEAVGSILVVAMLIVPATTAHLLTDRLPRMMLVASGVAVLSAAIGYRGAVALNSSVAGMMAVVAGAQFALAVSFAPRHGLLGRAAHRAGLSLRIAREDVLARLYRAEEANPDLPVPADPAGLDGRRPSTAAVGLVGALAIRQLRARGQLRTSDAGTLGLTGPGRAEARELVRSHRLWESYLNENFDLPADHLHDPAERIEHFIGPALRAELAAALDRPDADPHGRAIPPEGSEEGTSAPDPREGSSRPVD
ncbi:metal ABC transporter permease [Tautonia plasticadhaerens]|uniref:Manganese transport system membrane protein MntB n=1 Tax=Tautonia plasticadhaerens TaxID=2527974 RepID=A0A518GVK1_9BACT|nr:metal ABC transporter permease [Tautonia plasticadhaerens]QDV32624.1 Manganese transport system membrane protein MntB [Tautonia plasticadhaerens]